MPKGDFLKLHWAKKKALIAKSKKEGRVTVTLVGRRIHVTCPYNPAFIGGAKALSGTYNDRSGVWSFRQEAHELVLSLAGSVFGLNSLEVEK